MGRNRLVEEVDRELFNIVKLTASAVPLVLVLTKKDGYLAKVRDEHKNTLMEDNDLESDDEEVLAKSRKSAEASVKQRTKRFCEEFEKLRSYNFCGPVLTSNKKSKHIKPDMLPAALS